MRIIYLQPDADVPPEWRRIRAEGNAGVAVLARPDDAMCKLRRTFVVPSYVAPGYWIVQPRREARCWTDAAILNTIIPWGRGCALEHAARILLAEPIREDWRRLAAELGASGAAAVIYDRWAPLWRDAGGCAAISDGIAAFFSGCNLWVAVGSSG